MDDAAPAATKLDPVGRPDRFDSATMAMHWATLLLLVVMFAASWTLSAATDAPTADRALLVHRSTGALLWLVTLARLAWRPTFGRPVELPRTIGRLQGAAARATQYGLYVLLVVQPITGFLQSILRGKPFPLLGFAFPAVMARDRGLTKVFHDIHALGAWALLALIALHVGAALYHHFALRDGVLRSMIPPRPRLSGH